MLKYEMHSEQEELVYIPAQVKIVIHRTPCYICRKCVNNDDYNPCVNPEVWKPLFSHSKCSSSLLVVIVDYEYDMGLPSTTIERTFANNNIIVPRQNITNWILASIVYIEPIYQLMKEDKPGRKVEYPTNFLKGFNGYLVSDKYSGYNTVESNFKPFIIHRNRSRFYVSPKGAYIVAKIYSLMLSAKANGYTTYGYFSYLFENIRYVDLNNKEELRKFLPYSNEIPEYCKFMTKSEIKKKKKELEAQTHKR